ncbi:MAG: phosphosulfolactate synthase [Nitrososphaerota archaeon]|nr:phosphosulfolactate synthase [Nitrososphaerota archaeon]
MAKTFLSEVLGAPRPGESGKTMVLDRLAQPLDDLLGLVGPYADIAKIGWGLPFLVEEKALVARVRTYRHHGISVSNGGTLLEICVSKGKETAALGRLAGAGFDTVELSEGVIDIPWRVKKAVADFAHSRGFMLCVEVGRKNPKNQLSLEETASRVEQSLDLDPSLVIIEGRETGRSVGIYDGEGKVKWDWVTRLEETSRPQKLLFEAPMETQQTELIMHIGPQVNLGNVDLRSIGALETQRRGLRGDTFGVLPGSKKVSGGPGAKFLYFVVSAHGPIDQSRLVRLTGLNRRTVQASLKSLLDQGVITETLDPGDLRRRVYSSRG